jgi:hypothetical protein
MMDEMSVAEQARAMKEKLTDAEIIRVDEYRNQLIDEMDQLVNKVTKKDEIELPTEEDV